MKTKIYLFALVFAALCFQACDKTGDTKMEEVEEEEEEEETEALKGDWELEDISGDISETLNFANGGGNEYAYYFSLKETSGYTLNIEQDTFSTIGEYQIRVITTKNGDTTSIGITSYSSGNSLGEYQINKKYTFTDDTLTYEYNGLFGLHFPSPHSDFTFKNFESQNSSYIIEEDKLIIKTNEEGNAEPNYAGDELEYEFITTWIKVNLLEICLFSPLILEDETKPNPLSTKNTLTA